MEKLNIDEVEPAEVDEIEKLEESKLQKTNQLKTKVKKSGAGKQVTINTCNARSDLALLNDIISKHPNWRGNHLKNKFQGTDIFWLAGPQDDEEYMMEHNCIFNKLPGIGVASRKRRFAQITKFNIENQLKVMDNYGQDYDFIPRTFTVPGEEEKLKSYMKSNPKKTFICKPDEGSEGCGILLAQKYSEIPKQAMNSPYVIQDYLCDPLLIDGKKFDLRIYVLILDLGSNSSSDPQPMLSFISKEALARFCTLPYEKPNKDNMHKLLSHLTNFTLNKLSKDFVSSENLDQENQIESSKRTLTSVFEQLEKENNVDTDKLFENIKDVIGKLLTIMQPFCLQRQNSQIDMAKSKGDCFQIIGVDVFIDKNLKPWILEVNDSPSMNINICKEGNKGEGLISNVSEVDKYIKSRILYQTFNLMLKNGHSKNRETRRQLRSEIETFDVWHRIDMQGYIDENQSIMFATQIYNELDKYKKQEQLSCMKFSKLYKYKSNKKFGQTHYELLYKKMANQYGGQNSQMPLELFFYALLELSAIFDTNFHSLVSELVKSVCGVVYEV